MDAEDVDGLDIGHILDNYENKILTYQRDELLKKIAASTNKDMILAEISELNKKIGMTKRKSQIDGSVSKLAEKKTKGTQTAGKKTTGKETHGEN